MLSVLQDNKVYVSDTWNFRIQIFDIEGKLLGKLCPRVLSLTRYLSRVVSNALYSPGSIGKQGSLPGEFEEPRDIAIDTNGNVLVTDTSKNTLQIFDKNGQFIRVRTTMPSSYSPPSNTLSLPLTPTLYLYNPPSPSVTPSLPL